jgi:hypothetical protein
MLQASLSSFFFLLSSAAQLFGTIRTSDFGAGAGAGDPARPTRIPRNKNR